MKRKPNSTLITIFVLLTFILVGVRCGNKSIRTDNKYTILYSQTKYNEQVAEQVYVRDLSDTSDQYILTYFIGTRKIKGTYYLHNRKKNGLQKLYYDNGELKEKGEWFEGKRNGLFFYYNKEGWVEYTREFILFSGDAKGYFLNRVYAFSKNGDTLKEKSNYYTLSGRDTITYGDTYDLKFILDAPINKMSGFVVCDYDSVFTLNNENTCDTTLMINYTGNYLTNKYKRGDNTIRGIIYDFSELVNSSGDSITRGRTFYFTKSFYAR